MSQKENNFSWNKEGEMVCESRIIYKRKTEKKIFSLLS